MATQKILKKYFLLTILSGIVAIAPQLSRAGEVQAPTEGDMGSSSKEDSYLKELNDNLKNIEGNLKYKAALADLKSSTADCISLKEWTYSKPDLSANLTVKKTMAAGTEGLPQGPTYTITLSFPDVRKDSFHAPIEIFSNPSLLTEVSLDVLSQKTIAKVTAAAQTNRLFCSRLASEKKEENKQVSSN